MNFKPCERCLTPRSCTEFQACPRSEPPKPSRWKRVGAWWDDNWELVAALSLFAVVAGVCAWVYAFDPYAPPSAKPAVLKALTPELQMKSQEIRLNDLTRRISTLERDLAIRQGLKPLLPTLPDVRR